MAHFCKFLVLLHIFLFFSSLSADILTEKNEKYLNCFIGFLKNLPSQPYIYEDGILINAQEIVSIKSNFCI